jgi:hypothetical protein
MKYEWSRDAVDWANLNSAATEEVSLEPFRDYLTWETNLQSSSDGATIIPAASNILIV